MSALPAKKPPIYRVFRPTDIIAAQGCRMPSAGRIERKIGARSTERVDIEVLEPLLPRSANYRSSICVRADWNKEEAK